MKLLGNALLDERSDAQARRYLLVHYAKIFGQAVGGVGLSILFSTQVNLTSLPVIRLVGALSGTAIAAKATLQARDEEELEQTLEMRCLARQDGKSAVLEAQVKQIVAQPQNTIALPQTGNAIVPAAGEYQPDLFDWNLLRSKSQVHAHIAILAPTGGGKTVTGEWLADLIGEGHHIKVVTTKAKSSQWRGMEVVGTPRNFDAIKEEVEQLKYEMVDRMGNLDAVESMPQEVRVFDELAAMVANIDKFEIGTFIREARETGIRIIALIHGEQVKLIGLEGESDTAEGLTWVRLGKFAIKYARKLVSKGELTNADLEWLKGQERPCLVDEQLAVIPNLSNWEPSRTTTGARAPVCTSDAPVAHQLEALLHQAHQSAPSLETWEPVDPFAPLTSSVRGLVWSLVRQNWSQNKILSTVWKCSKGGGSQSYKQARKLYLEITGEN